MIKFEKKIGNGTPDATVTLPRDMREKSRLKVTLDDGREAGLLIQRVHFFHSNMTKLEIKKNGVIIFESMPTAINSEIQKSYGRTAQAGLYVYDAIINNDIQRVLDTSNAQSLSYNISVSGSDTLTILNEAIADISKI